MHRAVSILSFFLPAAISMAPAAEVMEAETASGLARIMVIPLEGTGGTEGDSAAPGGNPADSGFGPGYALVQARGDAILEVYFLDKATGESVRFPLKHSDFLDFLKSRAGLLQERNEAERTVEIVRALSGSLGIQMREAWEEGEKP